MIIDEVVPGLYYAADSAGKMSVAERRTPYEPPRRRMRGDAVVAPTQEGVQGFYRLSARWSVPTELRGERCAEGGGVEASWGSTDLSWSRVVPCSVRRLHDFKSHAHLLGEKRKVAALRAGRRFLV